MRKLAIAVVVTASLAHATLALADDTPAVTGPATTTAPPAPATGNQLTVPATPTDGAVSTTRTTGSDVTATPPVATQYETDTTTLYRRVRPNKALLITGGATLLGTYGTTAGLTAANIDGNRVVESLYIPVVGPWLALGDRDCRECTSGQNTLDTVLIAGSGVLQGAGLGLVIASFIVPERVPAATISAGPVKMTFTATGVGRNAASFGAVGSF